MAGAVRMDQARRSDVKVVADFQTSRRRLQEATDPGAGQGVSEVKFDGSFKTNRIKLYFDSRAVPGWNEIDAVGLRDAAGKTQWATAVEASSTYAEQGGQVIFGGVPPPGLVAPVAPPVIFAPLPPPPPLAPPIIIAPPPAVNPPLIEVPATPADEKDERIKKLEEENKDLKEKLKALEERLKKRKQ